jgi:hypothetical protein
MTPHDDTPATQVFQDAADRERKEGRKVATRLIALIGVVVTIMMGLGVWAFVTYTPKVDGGSQTCSGGSDKACIIVCNREQPHILVTDIQGNKLKVSCDSRAASVINSKHKAAASKPASSNPSKPGQSSSPSQPSHNGSTNNKGSSGTTTPPSSNQNSGNGGSTNSDSNGSASTNGGGASVGTTSVTLPNLNLNLPKVQVPELPLKTGCTQVGVVETGC